MLSKEIDMRKDKTQRTSRLAIAAFIVAVLAIAGATTPIINFYSFLLAIAGLIFGIVSLIAIRKGVGTGQILAISAIVLSVVTFFLAGATFAA